MSFILKFKPRLIPCRYCAEDSIRLIAHYGGYGLGTALDWHAMCEVCGTKILVRSATEREVVIAANTMHTHVSAYVGRYA